MTAHLDCIHNFYRHVGTNPHPTPRLTLIHIFIFSSSGATPFQASRVCKALSIEHGDIRWSKVWVKLTHMEPPPREAVSSHLRLKSGLDLAVAAEFEYHPNLRV